MDGNVVQPGDSITSRGLAAGRAPVVRHQGGTSQEKVTGSSSGGSLTWGTSAWTPLAGPGEYPGMLLPKKLGIGEWCRGDLQKRVTTLH